jgi:hypothetical protein
VNWPNLGDTWHLSCGSTSPRMTLVSHVNPHHMVEIYPHGSIDPQFSLLHDSGIQSLPTPLDENPSKRQISRLSDLAPCVIFDQQSRFTSTFVTLAVFTLHRLLAKFLWSTKSPDYKIVCHVPTHPMILVQWTTFDSG